MALPPELFLMPVPGRRRRSFFDRKDKEEIL